MGLFDKFPRRRPWWRKLWPALSFAGLIWLRRRLRS